MNAQELRIGNYLFCDEVKQVEDIVKTEKYFIGFAGDRYRYDEIDIEPIPLTEDWLIKFGFKKTYEYKTIMFYVAHTVKEFHNHSDYSIIHDEKEGWRLYIASYMDEPPSVRIKYVHELQNLYFALSKKELKRII